MMLSYSEDQEGHPRLLRMASELVGVAGFDSLWKLVCQGRCVRNLLILQR